MKVAYISHHGRPCYEYRWFSHLGVTRIKFIDVDFESYPREHPDHVEYCPVEYEENRFLRNVFHSSASAVRYKNFEKHLADVDVVIVLEAFSFLARQFIEYCAKTRKKCVVLVYELIPTHPLYYLPTHITNRRRVLRHADSFVCVSTRAKEHLIKLGVASHKAVVIYPGIDLTTFKPSQPGGRGDGLVFVGGLKPHKGIDLLLRLADVLLPKRNNLRIGVVGDGTYRNTVMEYATKYPNFRYYGKVPNGDLPSILTTYGVYVLPAREITKYGFRVTSEQFGFSLVEAMACGLSIVSTFCGAIPEVITDNNLLSEPGNFEALFTNVSSLIDTPERIYDIGQRNIDMARDKYDIIKQGMVLTQHLKKIAVCG